MDDALVDQVDGQTIVVDAETIVEENYTFLWDIESDGCNDNEFGWGGRSPKRDQFGLLFAIPEVDLNHLGSAGGGVELSKGWQTLLDHYIYC